MFGIRPRRSTMPRSLRQVRPERRHRARSRRSSHLPGIRSEDDACHALRVGCVEMHPAYRSKQGDRHAPIFPRPVRQRRQAPAVALDTTAASESNDGGLRACPLPSAPGTLGDTSTRPSAVLNGWRPRRGQRPPPIDRAGLSHDVPECPTTTGSRRGDQPGPGDPLRVGRGRPPIHRRPLRGGHRREGGVVGCSGCCPLRDTEGAEDQPAAQRTYWAVPPSKNGPGTATAPRRSGGGRTWHCCGRRSRTAGRGPGRGVRRAPPPSLR